MNWTQILGALLPLLIAQLPSLLNNSHPAVSAGQTIMTNPDVEKKFIETVQTALNAAQALGYISFGPALVVDGIAGSKTTAAFQSILAKLNIRT